MAKVNPALREKMKVSDVRQRIHRIIRDVDKGGITTFGVNNDLVCITPYPYGYAPPPERGVTLRTINLESLKQDFHNIMLAVVLLNVEFVVIRQTPNSRGAVALIRQNYKAGPHPALVYT